MTHSVKRMMVIALMLLASGLFTSGKTVWAERGEQTVQDAQAVNHGFGSENFGKNMPETETKAADEEIRTDITEVGKGADEDE